MCTQGWVLTLWLDLHMSQLQYSAVLVMKGGLPKRVKKKKLLINHWQTVKISFPIFPQWNYSIFKYRNTNNLGAKCSYIRGAYLLHYINSINGLLYSYVASMQSDSRITRGWFGGGWFGFFFGNWHTAAQATCPAHTVLSGDKNNLAPQAYSGLTQKY